MNLKDVSKEIQAQLDAINEHAKELGDSEASWWNNVSSQIPSRVEATKKAIDGYGYNDIVGTLAAQENIDPNLILSLITVESNGEVNPTSNPGFYGCMQTNSDYFKGSMGSDPRVNAQLGIEAGIAAVKDKYNYFPDNIYLVIAAYNAGQGTVENGLLGTTTPQASLEWWSSIRLIAYQAEKYWGASKYQEVGEYAAKVMYAYSLFSGYKVNIGTLPQASNTSGSFTNNMDKLVGGLSGPADSSPRVAGARTHGKHADSIIEAPDKTYCEPVYADLISISSEIPSHIIDSLNLPPDELVPGADMFYSIPVSTLTKYGGQESVDFSAFNAALEEQRKVAFDADKHKNAFKIPSKGKPANNNDPFPVDLKIEELESHEPRCKISQIIACPEAVSTAKACIKLSINTEKRLVKLENNMATILRYLYRFAARIPINCVYYGGQSTYEKYKCIRCLKDDRIADGQMMSMDQCLNCTRYEPIIGQVYDILNDQGINLSHILDDAQMSYTTMEEYCDFVKASSYQKDLETVTLGVDTVQNRLINEQDFSDTWSQGLKMDWNLFPVEDQKPHINARQSINVDNYGSKLDSYFGTTTNYGYAYTGNTVANKIVENKNLMLRILETTASNSNTSSTEKVHIAYNAISEAKDYAETHAEEFVSNMTTYLGKNISDRIKAANSNIDNLLVASIVFVTGQAADDVIKKYSVIENDLRSKSIDNIIIAATFYDLDQKNLFGDDREDKLPKRLDKVTKFVEQKDSESGSTTKVEVGFNLNWNNVNNWNWTEFIEPLNINYLGNQNEPPLSDNLKFFAKIAFVYSELQSKCHTSNMDSDAYGLAFPFFEEDLGNIYYTSPFGYRASFGSMHYGVDLAGPEGTPIHSIADGTVAYALTPEDANGGGNMICIQHANNLSSRYMHMTSLIVSAGQNISKGQIVGYLGNTGHSTGPHLHFEVQVGGTSSSNSQDPCGYYPRLGAIPVGGCLGSY